MSFFKRERPKAGPTLETNASATADTEIVEAVPASAGAQESFEREALPAAERNKPKSQWSPAAKWFFNDIFYIAMLLLAVAGVMFRLSVDYWIIITPIFALISIIEGWSHFATQNDRLGFVFRIAAIWFAVALSIYVFDNTSVKGVMTPNATSLAIITLLALGTFVAGVQAHVWQICAVGGLLFVSVPGVGWLEESPLLIMGVMVLLIMFGAVAWRIEESRVSTARDS